jgi:hypothetical protein
MPRLGKTITPTEIVQYHQNYISIRDEHTGGVLRFSSFIFETNGQQEIQKFLRYEKKSRLA